AGAGHCPGPAAKRDTRLDQSLGGADADDVGQRPARKRQKTLACAGCENELLASKIEHLSGRIRELGSQLSSCLARGDDLRASDEPRTRFCKARDPFLSGARRLRGPAVLPDLSAW